MLNYNYEPSVEALGEMKRFKTVLGMNIAYEPMQKSNEVPTDINDIF